MQITHISPSPKEYIDLRIKTNMGSKKLENAKIALDSSIFVVSIRKDGKLIGFGRLVGDNAISYVVSDIMVDPTYQGQGIGKIIMQEIDDYIEKNCDEDAFVILLAKKPADKLYSKFGFKQNEILCGMKRDK